MILVIGGGPAGCMAALSAAIQGAPVILLEQNEKIGKKWYITGKGRCNLTNDADMSMHLSHIRRNPKFLMGAFARYTKEDIKRFFISCCVAVKTERGERVFPVSDKSSDTISAFQRALKEAGVQILLNTKVDQIEKKEDYFTVQAKGKEYRARAVIIATGGLSYPVTGSTGDGYRWAKHFGHRIKPLYPSLVGLNLLHPYPDLSGLSLRNIRLEAKWGKKAKEWFGELLFTHYGISGPVVLQMSAEAPVPFAAFPLYLNFKPALHAEQLSARIQREVDKDPLKEIGTIANRLLPQSLVPHVIRAAGIDPKTRGAVFTAKDRRKLTDTLLHFPLDVGSFRGFSEAIITRGWVFVQEVDAKSMQSKKVEGLYFCGEVLDIDADTGGYNMQIAWSTGFVAGTHAAGFGKEANE